ncbi:MAG: anthranilate synthase component I [Pseudomonadota bacterium]|nr:anthranilate synthase component I [Pseudomonadota bacterium]
MMKREQFDQLLAGGYTHIPVYRQRLADTDTPLAVYARLREAGVPAYLFESVQGGERWGRYSMIGLGQGVTLQYQQGEMLLQTEAGIERQPCADPFQYIRDFQARYRIPTQAELPELTGFSGGLIGYFGYDCVRCIEPKLGAGPTTDPIGLPEIWLTLSQTVVVFDSLRDTVFLIVHVDAAHPHGYDEAQRALDALEQRLAQPLHLQAQPHTPPQFVSQYGEQAFMAGVEKIQEYIRAGDVMQVVPSQRMSSAFDGDALAVYRALRHLNPSPYLFLVQGYTLQDQQPFDLVGSSPEILSRLEHGVVTVRPIAGTRPRGTTPEQDLALEADLLADAKEIAEHVMLIDLGRNDVGRVSQVGQVRVTERMSIERYSHVMHIVSNVEGKVREGLDALDVFKATFPAGTLSGAPKIRAMEIIDELETVRRGVFGGAVGYLGWHGEMDTAIAIRTAVIRAGQVHVQAGAGVVADSVPASEWHETLIKARAVVRAVELSASGLVI